MSAQRFKGLRTVVIVLLIALVFQFEAGVTVTLSNPPSLPPFLFSLSAVLGALGQAGTVAVVHATLGTLLTLTALLNLVMALSSRVRSVQITGSLGFLSMALAATSGLLFTLSGFQNDHYSHGMATNFVLTFGLHFLELYFLKPVPERDASFPAAKR